MEKKYYTEEQILEALSEVGVGAGDTSEVLSYLSGLPSAEPEIIRSKDSIVYRKDVVEALYQALRTQLQGTFTDSMSLAISMAKALPSAEPKTGKWIPCSERYPEENQICIVTDETMRNTYEYRFCKETYDENQGWTYLKHRIIAWMPLPKPYTKGEE